MIIRTATVEDLPIMLRWRNTNDYNYCGNYIESNLKITEYVNELNHGMLEGIQEYTAIGLLKDKPFGMMWADHIYENNKETLISIYIDINFRNNHGLIVFLIECIIKIHKENKTKNLYCEISPYNSKMLLITRKLGFTFIKKKKIENDELLYYKINLKQIENVKSKYYKPW